ncbi:MAG TPA: EthD domain-containing protein [Candidatus Binataceae bacterium]|nr:EthD domain-containing protein [Candidatus Binataceae bacterium]
MIHSHYFIVNKTGMPLDEFFTYWRKRHVRAVSDPVPQIRRYAQSHRIPDPPGDAIYQGCAESWYDNLEDVLAMRNSGAYPKMLADERNFIDPGSTEFLLTEDRAIVDGERKPGMVKCLVLVKRKPAMTVAAFRQYWFEVHAPQAAKFDLVRRYVQCPTVDLAYAVAEPRWDGCAHIWFDDVESARRAATSKEYERVGKADASNFIGAYTSFWAREHLVIWPK